MIKLVRTTFAGLFLALGLLLATSSPAAAWTATDNFEPPGNNWTFIPVGAGSTVEYTNVGTHSGVRAMRLRGQAPGYALARRTMFIGHERTCTAGISVDPSPGTVPVPVNLEIVNPSNNQYIKLATKTIASNAGYTTIVLAFVSPVGNIDIRVAVGTSVPGAAVTATVDDLILECH
jgi:hypothetical protein